MSLLSGNEKWKNSLLSGVIFLVLNLPATYKLTDGILGSLTRTSNFEGCPTTSGLILHTIVFIVVIRLLMDVN